MIILRVCTALTEELLFLKAKAKAKGNTSVSVEGVELTSPIDRRTVIGATIAGNMTGVAGVVGVVEVVEVVGVAEEVLKRRE
jgi:hypothetical protein